MSITSITGSSTASVAWATQSQTTKRQDAVDTVASLLDMSKGDLLKELRSGQSMDDVAKAAGVSHDDLVAALKKNMPSELAESGDADQIAETIATQKGMPVRGPGGPQGPPPPPPAEDDEDSDISGIFGSSLSSSQTQTLKELSDLLGTDSDSLLSALKDGKSLTDLVSSKGISSSALAGVLQDGLLIDAKA